MSSPAVDTASAEAAGGQLRVGAPLIEISELGRYFKSGEIHALDGINLDIADDEFVSLVGPSGCGKTTLLRMIDGLIKPDLGHVLVAGRPPRPGPELGFVFQQARLMPWRTIRRNIEFPLAIQGVGRRERAARANELLRLVGLGDFAEAFPHELSGGMQQRVGLARSFALDPKVLLMDEPFAALDALTREFMRTELLRLWSQRRTAVVFVTHDIDEAILLSQRIVLMSPRPGRVDEIITVDLPEPRWEIDVRADPTFIAIREHLWDRIREMVADAPEWAGTHAADGSRRDP